MAGRAKQVLKTRHDRFNSMRQYTNKQASKRVLHNYIPSVDFNLTLFIHITPLEVYIRTTKAGSLNALGSKENKCEEFT